MTPEPPQQTPVPQPPPPGLVERLRAAPVSSFFFACCIVVFAIAERSGSTQSTETLLRFGADSRNTVWHGEWWRLFTSMFLHIGIVHLVWNIWAGFSWCAPFERMVGPVRFALIYLLSGLAGSALSVIGHDVVSAGASGALFGIMGGVFVVQRLMLGSWAALWSDPGVRRNALMTVVWLAIGPFVGFDSFAHGGGMLAGVVLTWSLLPLRVPRLVGAVALVALLIGASLRPIPGFHDAYLARAQVTAAFGRQDWPAVLAGTESVTKKPDPELAFYRAQALVFSDRLEEAEALLPQLDGLGLSANRVRAMVLFNAGKDDPALKEIDLGLAAEPKDPYLVSMRASVLLSKGDGPGASAEAVKLLALTPDALDATVLRSETLAATHRFAEALVLLDTAVRRAPGKYEPMRLRLLLAMGRTDEVREALKTATFDATQVALIDCALEASVGDFAAAQPKCEAADEVHEPWARELEATVAVGLGDCEQARELMNAARKWKTTRSGDALLGLCALRDGDLGEAERFATDALAPDPTAVEGLLLRLAIASVQGDAKPALAPLVGLEAEATHSLFWPLLPEEARAVLPRR